MVKGNYVELEQELINVNKDDNAKSRLKDVSEEFDSQPNTHNIQANFCDEIELIRNTKKIPDTLYSSYFFIQGMLALGCFFAILDITDFVNEQFPDYMFNFWADMPGNIALPLSIPIIKFLATCEPNLRMYMSIAMNVIFTNLMLVFIFGYPNNTISFFLLNFMNFIANVFCFIQQGYLVNTFSVFPDNCISWYFTGTGVCCLFYFGLREILLIMELSKSTQVQTVFGFMTFVMILGLILHTLLIKTSYYKSVYPYLKKTTPVTWSQYKESFLLIKKEFLMTFVSVGQDYIPYPGVIFSIRPKSMFNVAEWNTFVSLSLGIADTFGKFISRYNCLKCLILKTFWPAVVFNLGLIVYYFTNIWQDEEMEWLTLVLFFGLILSWIRAGMVETFYTIETKKYITKENSHIIGTVINFAIVSGIAITGSISQLVGYIYAWVY